jgi:transcriptional regulator with XRE-family HTH domain
VGVSGAGARGRNPERSEGSACEGGKNISQTILAERVGTDQSTISRIENGKQETCLRFIEELAQGLKTPLKDLFDEL